MLAACLESIRRVQAQRTASNRLDNNRVFLHVWPPIEVPLSDLSAFAQISAPLTLGTGLAEITVLARLRQAGRVAAERGDAVQPTRPARGSR